MSTVCRVVAPNAFGAGGGTGGGAGAEAADGAGGGEDWRSKGVAGRTVGAGVKTVPLPKGKPPLGFADADAGAGAGSPDAGLKGKGVAFAAADEGIVSFAAGRVSGRVSCRISSG